MAKKVTIPWELKYKFAMGGWTTNFKSWLYVVREEYGADIALKLYEKVLLRDDRITSFTNSIKNVFKLEGNDVETIGEWFDIWWELMGADYTILERSKTFDKRNSSECPFKTGAKDIGDWVLLFTRLVAKAINPKATSERPKGMCAGDSYCEYIFRIEE